MEPPPSSDEGFSALPQACRPDDDVEEVVCLDASDPPLQDGTSLPRILVGLNTAGYFAAFLGLGLLIAAPGPSLLAMSERTHSSIDRVSTIFSVRALGYFSGTLLSGLLLDRAPQYGNQMLAVGLVLTGVCTVLIPSAESLWVMMALVAPAGATMGLLDTGGNVMLIRLYGAAVEPFMQALHFFFGVGAFLSPIILRSTLGNGVDYDSAFYTFGAYVGAVGLFVAPLPSPMPSAESESGCSPSMGKQQLSSEWKVIIGTAGFLGVYVGLEVATGAFLHAFAVEGPVRLKPEQGELLTATYWGGIAVGRLLAVPIALCCSPKMMMAVDLIGCIVTSGLLVTVGAEAVLWTVAAGFGLSMASIFPTALNVVGSVLDLNGKVATIMVVGASLGEMALPLAAGWLFEQTGPRSLPPVILFTAIVQALWFFALNKLMVDTTKRGHVIDR